MTFFELNPEASRLSNRAKLNIMEAIKKAGKNFSWIDLVLLLPAITALFFGSRGA